MLRLLNVSRRMAIIELTGGSKLTLTRSRKDGSTVGVSYFGSGWKTLDVNELLDALTWVTMTDEQLISNGVPEAEVKVPRKKRPTKKEREAKRKEEEEDNPFSRILRGM